MTTSVASWQATRIRGDQITRYLDSKGRDFIDDEAIENALRTALVPDAQMVRDIVAKSRAICTLTMPETAALMNVRDRELWNEMEQSAGEIKRSVYDNRVVTFAPLYLSTRCVNGCVYCGFRKENNAVLRGVLSQDEVRKEVEVLAGRIGHKRIVAVCGEHPESDAPYMAESIGTVYNVKTPARRGYGSIRRVNVNAAPLSIEDLGILRKAGLGTYQVFQETYHRTTYSAVHSPQTLKGNFRWRLYCMHRAIEAGVDDVGIGVLFGLFDWKYEILGLLSHAIDLESRFGIGPHTISFPRIESAENTPFVRNLRYRVNDEDFRKLVTVIRLAVPYTGMILTARENARMRRELIPLGITQTDASSNIGLGAYNDVSVDGQVAERQQFMLGDTRSLDEIVRELAGMGIITSFCTAGYRCGRTGKCIMDLLRTGTEGKFCKLNAVLTFREWLDDFAGSETVKTVEHLVRKEIEEIRIKMPETFDLFMKRYDRTVSGERDIYF